MAKLTGPVKFIGTIGGLSAYHIEGSQEVFAREKGGPPSNRVKKSPKFANTRRNNAEFSSINIAVEHVKRAIGMLDSLRDYNYTPILNGLCLDLQKMDAIQKWGERGYAFSLYGHLLEGFSLNRQVFFGSIVRPTIECQIDRTAGTATLSIPTLKPTRNLFIPWKAPMFRFVIMLGMIEDISWKGEKYTAGEPLQRVEPKTVYTPWYFSDDIFKAQTITLQLDRTGDLAPEQSMLVSIGIQGGSGVATDQLGGRNKQKYSAAKILKVG